MAHVVPDDHGAGRPAKPSTRLTRLDDDRTDLQTASLRSVQKTILDCLRDEKERTRAFEIIDEIAQRSGMSEWIVLLALLKLADNRSIPSPAWYTLDQDVPVPMAIQELRKGRRRPLRSGLMELESGELTMKQFRILLYLTTTEHWRARTMTHEIAARTGLPAEQVWREVFMMRLRGNLPLCSP